MSLSNNTWSDALGHFVRAGGVQKFLARLQPQVPNMKTVGQVANAQKFVARAFGSCLQDMVNVQPGRIALDSFNNGFLLQLPDENISSKDDNPGVFIILNQGTVNRDGGIPICQRMNMALKYLATRPNLVGIVVDCDIPDSNARRHLRDNR